MKMNKTGFIKKLQKELNYNEEKCIIINSVLEDHFIIGKNNKEKIINDLIEKLTITEEEAENIYETSSKIISSAIKNKIVHPFKSQD